MSSTGTILISEIRAMLNLCAPGHSFKAHGDHYYLVSYGRNRYPSLPRGAHGKKDPEIQRGHVKRMVRMLDIEECAKKALDLGD
jgi:hypothetical protein